MELGIFNLINQTLVDKGQQFLVLHNEYFLLIKVVIWALAFYPWGDLIPEA
jgi:hypothetical protein